MGISFFEPQTRQLFILFEILFAIKIIYPSAAKGGDEGKPEGVNFID